MQIQKGAYHKYPEIVGYHSHCPLFDLQGRQFQILMYAIASSVKPVTVLLCVQHHEILINPVIKFVHLNDNPAMVSIVHTICSVAVGEVFSE